MPATSPASATEPRIDSVKTIAEGQWVSLQQLNWIDGEGNSRLWERSCRTNHARRKQMLSDNKRLNVPNPKEPQPNGVTKPDATSVLTLGYHKNKAGQTSTLLQRDDVEIVLLKQYRPPVCAYSLEFPAGLIDEDEDPVAAGVRELKEETGFTAEKILHVSPQLSLAPGVSTESCILLVAVVNFDDPVNANPTQKLDETEDIEVLRIPLKSMMQEFDKFKKSGGIIFEEVYCTAIGLLVLPTIQLG